MSGHVNVEQEATRTTIEIHLFGKHVYDYAEFACSCVGLAFVVASVGLFAGCSFRDTEYVVVVAAWIRIAWDAGAAWYAVWHRGAGS